MAELPEVIIEGDIQKSINKDKAPSNDNFDDNPQDLYSKLLKEYEQNPNSFNKTDPKVVFDPKFNAPITLKIYKPENEVGGSTNNNNTLNPLKDDAIFIPLVTINNYSVPDNKLEYFKLTYDDFLPKLHLKIQDEDNFINSTDNSGMVNQITIVITAEINGYYKKISLGFFITKSYREDIYMIYDAIYKFQSLNSSNMYMIKNDGSNKLNTYDLLSRIASVNGLGFASTDKCKDIDDSVPRIINSRSYIDFIKEQISFAGNDEAIFDCWVDLYGYLVLVNVYYVINERVDADKLVIWNMGNVHGVENESPEVKPFLSYRILTNKEMDSFPHNMFFRKLENIIDNSKIYKEGSLSTNWSMSSPCNENIIHSDQVVSVENSIDGMRNHDKYEFEKTNFLGIEFNDNGTSILNQKIVNKKFLDKLKAKRTKIQLENYNLGLERGTLLYIQFKDYDKNIQNINNPKNGDFATKENNTVDTTATGLDNPYIPGFYYIDSMEFEYYKENHKITHYLYLIRKSVSISSTDFKMAEYSTSKDETE